MGKAYICEISDVGFSVEVMMTKNDVAQLYDTILSIPGMSETVKIDLRISRTSVLLLTHVIDRGLNSDSDGEGSSILDVISAESLQELRGVSDECLSKSGLTDLSAKLKAFDKAK